MPLLTTSTTIAAPYWTAVASSWPLIRKSPSPERQTTVRSGWSSFAAIAAGIAVPHRAGARRELRPVAAELVEAVRPDREVAGAVRQHRVVRQPLAQVRHHLAQVELAGQRLVARGSPGSRRAPPRAQAARCAPADRAQRGGELRRARRRSAARPRRRGRARPGRRGRGRASGAAAAARAASTAAWRSRRAGCRARGSRRPRARARRAPGPCPIVSTPGVGGRARCRRSPGGGTTPRPARSTPRRTRARRGRPARSSPLRRRRAAAARPRRAARARGRRPSRAGRRLRRPVRRGVGDVRLVGLHVLRQRDHHRPRPAGRRGVERVRDELGDRGGVLDHGHPLRHLAEHARVVELLEGLAAEVPRAAPGRRAGPAASSPGTRCGSPTAAWVAPGAARDEADARAGRSASRRPRPCSPRPPRAGR